MKNAELRLYSDDEVKIIAYEWDGLKLVMVETAYDKTRVSSQLSDDPPDDVCDSDGTWKSFDELGDDEVVRQSRWVNGALEWFVKYSDNPPMDDGWVEGHDYDNTWDDIPMDDYDEAMEAWHRWNTYDEEEL